jgi:hypothetical protein
VVVKNVQNVWMTNIPDVLCWIKTGPFWSEILIGLNDI